MLELRKTLPYNPQLVSLEDYVSSQDYLTQIAENLRNNTLDTVQHGNQLAFIRE